MFVNHFTAISCVCRLLNNYAHEMVKLVSKCSKSATDLCDGALESLSNLTAALITYYVIAFS